MGFERFFEVFFQGFWEFLETLWELRGVFLEAPGGSVEALRESIFEQPSRVFGALLHVFVRRGKCFKRFVVFARVFRPLFSLFSRFCAQARMFSAFFRFCAQGRGF